MPAGDYKVVDTDYDNYTVVFGCTGLGLFNIEYVWILTREASPDQSIIDQAIDSVQTKLPQYDISALYATPQGDSALASGESCPYDSQPTASSPTNYEFT